MLKECRIILPLTDNVGASLASEITWLARHLANKFGGSTRFTLAEGNWLDGDDVLIEDAVIVFDVAVPDTEATCKYLLALCKWLRRTTHQDCVYLRLPTGEVLLVE
jgi:hypothetical protein